MNLHHTRRRGAALLASGYCWESRVWLRRRRRRLARAIPLRRRRGGTATVSLVMPAGIASVTETLTACMRIAARVPIICTRNAARLLITCMTNVTGVPSTLMRNVRRWMTIWAIGTDQTPIAVCNPALVPTPILRRDVPRIAEDQALSESRLSAGTRFSRCAVLAMHFPDPTRERFDIGLEQLLRRFIRELTALVEQSGCVADVNLRLLQRGHIEKHQ